MHECSLTNFLATSLTLPHNSDEDDRLSNTLIATTTNEHNYAAISSVLDAATMMVSNNGETGRQMLIRKD